MQVKRIDANSAELLDPGSAAWGRARTARVVLSPTPLAIQPTDYVRASWQGRPYGKVSSMRVGALHNGRDIFFRLAWEDGAADSKIADINEFVDAAAVLFPVAPDAPLIGMGTPGKPVTPWFWRGDWGGPKNGTAHGVGATN